jgi:hypothetical protein
MMRVRLEAVGTGGVARASRLLWRGHPARAREQDAPATAGETPALQAVAEVLL